MTDKHYSIEIVDTKNDCLVHSTTMYQTDIKSIGGIGNYIESLDSILEENQQIVLTPFWG